VERKRPDQKKVKEAKAVLDERVFEFIKKRAPLTRVMNLVNRPGVTIPPIVQEDHAYNNPYRIIEWQMYRIIGASLRRLKRKGRIWCNKSGTPFWEVHQEDLDG